jgi:hypothetical protein
MEDVNVSNDLRQLSHGQVKALEYSHYDINEYHFRTAELEANHPLAATANSGVVTSDEDATGHVIDYYDILQDRGRRPEGVNGSQIKNFCKNRPMSQVQTPKSKLYKKVMNTHQPTT